MKKGHLLYHLFLAFIAPFFMSMQSNVMDDTDQSKELLLKIETQTKEQLKANNEKALAEFAEIVEKTKEGLLSSDEFQEAAEKIMKASADTLAANMKAENDKLAEKVEELVNSLKTQGDAINSMIENGNGGAKVDTFESILTKKLEEAGALEEYTTDEGEKMTRIKESSIKGGLSIKALIDMTTALTYLPGSTPGTAVGAMTDYAANRVNLPVSMDTHMAQIFMIKRITGQYFGVAFYYSETDGMATKLENVASAGSSFKIKTLEYYAHDVTTVYNASKNVLEDTPGMLQEMQRRAVNNTQKLLDSKILGTGTDKSNTGDIVGLLGTDNYTAFVPTTWENTVQNANEIDVIKHMRAQARNTDYGINAVILHPDTIMKIESLKDEDNNYLKSLGIVFDALGRVTRIAGLAVIENSNMATNAALGINSQETGEIGMRRDIQMEIGHNSDDLTKRMVSIVFTSRIAFAVKDVNTVIYSDNLTDDAVVLNKS